MGNVLTGGGGGAHEAAAAAAPAPQGGEDDKHFTDDDIMETTSEYTSESGLFFNESVRARIRDNDPSVDWVHVKFLVYDGNGESFANQLNWESEGGYFGANTNLKRLTVTLNEYHFDDARRSNVVSFFRAVAQSKTIKFLRLRDGRFIDDGWLFPILQSFSLDRLEFWGCEVINEAERVCFPAPPRIVAPRVATDVVPMNIFWSSLASTLSDIESRSLKEFAMVANKGVAAESLRDILTSLKGHADLSTLTLVDRDNRDGCSQSIRPAGPGFWDLLRSPWCQITDLDLGSSHISDDGLDYLTAVLTKSNNSLQRLCLRNNKGIGSRKWQAFATCLPSPFCVLEQLILSENGLSDEDAASLGGALSNNKTLRFLHMDHNEDITAKGWAAFFTCLQGGNSSLESIRLCDNRIHDGGLVALGNALRSNSALRSLRMGHSDTDGSAGWRGLATALQSPTLPLERIDMKGCELDDEGINSLANGLAGNSKVKELDLSELDISSVGWREFFQRIQGSRLALETLILTENDIDDESVSAMVASLGSVSSLKVLGLWMNDSITKPGMLALANLIRAPGCMLEELNVGGNPSIDDEVLIAFANAVADNRTVSKLMVAGNRLLDNDVEVTDRAWEAFGNVLCNRESIEGIYLSNHTLQMISDESDEERLLPERLRSLLQLNRNNTKHEAARQKILLHQICNKEGTDLEAFIGMELSVLPVAMAWIGRDDVGRSALYQLCRTLPSLFGTNDKAVSAGVKRKRV
ncbi:hypothetical protein ACHAXT_004259 [Thalassiosira profunda]